MLIDDDLRQRVEQAGTETGVESAEHLAGRHGAGGDAPVAGGGVVHGVVKAGWRNLAVVAGQLLAQRVAVVAVGTGGGKNRRQLRDFGASVGSGFEADG